MAGKRGAYVRLKPVKAKKPKKIRPVKEKRYRPPKPVVNRVKLKKRRAVKVKP